MSTCGYYGDNEMETPAYGSAPCSVCKKTLYGKQVFVSHQGDCYCEKHYNTVWRKWNREQLAKFFANKI